MGISMGMAKLWMFGLHTACWIDLRAPSTFLMKDSPIQPLGWIYSVSIEVA